MAVARNTISFVVVQSGAAAADLPAIPAAGSAAADPRRR